MVKWSYGKKQKVTNFQISVFSGSLLLFLNPLFSVALIDCGNFVFIPYFVMQYLMSFFEFCNHLAVEGRVGCFGLTHISLAPFLWDKGK